MKTQIKEIDQNEVKPSRPKMSLNLSVIPKRKVIFNPLTGNLLVEKPQVNSSANHMSENQYVRSNDSTNESLMCDTLTYKHPSNVRFFKDFSSAVKAIEKSPFKLSFTIVEEK